MSQRFNALVVDDNSLTRLSLQTSLGRLGYQVNSADSTADARIKLGGAPYHAVFAELCIKDEGGRGLARWVKTNFNNIKFFLVTGWKGDLEQQLLLFEGIQGVIKKPLMFNDIRKTVLEHFG
jgi:CheY-like chemotaxis protein